MAKAEKRPPEDFEVVLTLDSEEARVLRTFLGQFMAGPSVRKTDPRRVLSNVHQELVNIGIHPDDKITIYSEGKVTLRNRPNTDG